MGYQKNGIVIQRSQDSEYKGIDGENWYLNELDSHPYFKAYYDKHLDSSWAGNDFIDCCNDWDFIRRYLEYSDDNAISYRLLLCETNRAYPSIVLENKVKLLPLGFDYAYPGGDYYSCLKNDILAHRIGEFFDIRLNENGLFQHEHEILDFVAQRTKLETLYPQGTFEKGDFVIYRLSEVILGQNVAHMTATDVHKSGCLWYTVFNRYFKRSR
jgi:hypothetical protein